MKNISNYQKASGCLLNRIAEAFESSGSQLKLTLSNADGYL